MKKHCIFILTVVLLISIATSKNSLSTSVNMDDRKVKSPRVDATSTTSCIVKTASFYICYVMTGPFATIGWESV